MHSQIQAQISALQATVESIRAELAMQGRFVVPNVDKIVSTNGAVEINLKTGEIKLRELAIGSLPSARQMITVTADEWAERDLPSNAIKRYQFIGEQVNKIPAEHRDSAEFSTEDISFDRDGSDIRTTLTYQRLETAEEASARVARPVDFVFITPRGDVTVTSGGQVVARLGCWNDDEQRQSQVKYASAGLGLGVERQTVDQLLEGLTACVGPLDFEIVDPIEQIRRVIREELRPGGLLHRR